LRFYIRLFWVPLETSKGPQPLVWDFRQRFATFGSLHRDWELESSFFANVFESEENAHFTQWVIDGDFILSAAGCWLNESNINLSLEVEQR
jgi:hypothetical protein